MFAALANSSVSKRFSVSGDIAASSLTPLTVVTVPAGHSAVVQSIMLKDAGIVGTLVVGSTTVLSTDWNNPFAFSGSHIWIGAAAEAVKIGRAAGAGHLYYMVSGFIVPSSYLTRVTA